MLGRAEICLKIGAAVVTFHGQVQPGDRHRETERDREREREREGV